MKRLLALSFGLPLALVLLVALAAAPRYESGRVNDVTYHVFPGGVGVPGGPGRYLADGTADDVEIMEAINDMQASGVEGTVIVHAGNYNLDNPIYIGYQDGVPDQHIGMSLIGEGRVSLTYTGTELQDCSGFLINVSTLNDVNGREIKHLRLNCEDKINGLFANGLHHTGVSDIFINESKYIGVLAIETWWNKWEDIHFNEITGAAALFLRCNGTHVERILHTGGEDTNIPPIYSYYYPTFSGATWPETFQPLETLTATVGGEEAIFLGYSQRPSGSRMIVAYTDESSPDRFDDGEEVTGGTTGDTADITISASFEEYNTTAAIFLSGEGPMFTNYQPETVDYDTAPLVLLMIEDGHLSGIHHEQGSSQADNPADIMVKLNECDSVTISDINAIRNQSTRATARTCDVDQGTQTVDDMNPSTWGNALEAGDSIYMWDGVGGITDQIYTVSAANLTATSFEVDEDPGGDANDTVFTYGIDFVTRSYINTGVDMEECRSCTVENLFFEGLATSFVVVDALCQGCVVDTVQENLRFMNLTDAGWLAVPHPTAPVNDLGLLTKIRNLELYNPYTSATYTGLDDAVQVFDEVDGNTHKTTLMLHNLQVSIDGAGVGFGAVKMFDFPQGNILVTGTVVDLVIDATSQYDTGAEIDDDANGDFSCGTTGTADATLDGTDVDLAAKTDIAQLSGGTGPVDGPDTPLTPVPFNGTATAKDAYISVLIDDADIGGNTTIALRGTVTIHWIDLGDF